MNGTVLDTVAASAVTVEAEAPSLVGQMLAGRYDVLDLLGTGGMGAVYRARDRELDELVALKIIRRDLAALPAMVERFRHEVKLARRVTHVNVARTFELGTSEGVMFCTMELVDGESLSSRLRRGLLGVSEAVAVACAVCDGLAAAHAAGVIHRDIKPDNILLASDGRVVLADFGVAAAVAATGELSGTLAFMAPEQARGEPPTPAADVYSLGLVLGLMITGANPFDPRSVPRDLADVLGRATASLQQDRISSATALRQALEPWLEGAVRAPTAVRASVHATEVATAIVLAPALNRENSRAYLANAVHQHTLALLAKTPQLRVLPRVVGVATDDRPTFGIEFHLQDQLEVWITLERDAPIHMQFPVAVEHVSATAEAIASTIRAELARTQERDLQRREALELYYRARHDAYRDTGRTREAAALLERARALSPQDPAILAALAVCHARAAFFLPREYPDSLRLARVLATAAITTAPDTADAYIALGHLELAAGEPVRAAGHFRTAIARAPHVAEAHEQLGRMLLEAGHLAQAIGRLDDALAISPELRSAYWEISRAHALDGNWELVDAMVSDLIAHGLDRPLARARYGWWRNDLRAVAELRSQSGQLERVLWPGAIDAVFDLVVGAKSWDDVGPSLFAMLDGDSPNLRRRVFVAQLLAEAAALRGARDGVVESLEYSARHGLYDLHWLDRCPVLQPYRDVPGVRAVRERIAGRAAAILDALYGDNAEALSATQIAG